MTQQLELDVTDSVSEGQPLSSEHLLITPAWYGLKQQINHLAQFGGSVQVVWGESGSGKTALLELLASEVESTPYVVLYNAAGRGLAPLLRALLNELGVRVEPSSTPGELISALRGFVQSLEKDSARTVVAIDDAHLLDDGALAALISVLQGSLDSGFGLHFLFMGEPGLVERIDQLHLLDISVNDVEMPNFSPSELKTLLQGCVESKRLSSSVPVEQVQKIWVQSGGLPGVALDIADEISSAEEVEGVLWAKAGWPYSHIGALVVLVLVFLWAIFGKEDGVQNGADSTKAADPSLEIMHQSEQSVAPARPALAVSEGDLPSSNSDDLVLAEQVLEKTEPTISGSVSKTVEAQVAQIYQADADQTKPLTQSESVLGSDPKLANLKLEKRPDAEGGKNLPSVVDLDPNTLKARESIPSSLSTNTEFANTESAIIVSETTPQGEELAVASDEVKEQVVDQTKQVSITPSESVPSKVDVPVAEEKPPRPPASLLERSEQQLLSLPPNSYVLQLMATSALASLESYIEAQPNRQNLLFYQGVRNGKKLYILVEGFYNDTSAARSGIKNLPKNQQKGGPWPKRVSEIHGEIR